MKQKLLITINALNYGGAERVVSVLLEELKNDFDIHLVVYSKRADYDIPKEVTVFNLGQPFHETEFIRLLKIPFLSYRLYKYVRKHDIPVSVAFLNRACYLNAMMRSIWGYKGKLIMCQRTHLSAIFETTSRLYKTISGSLLKFSYRKANMVLLNSKLMKEDLYMNFHVRTPMEVIYNPVDIDVIRSKSMEKTNRYVFDPAYFHFIIVGGLRIEKNQALAIEAMALLNNSNYRLVICGEGVCKDQLVQRTTELGLKEKIIFLDFDPNPFQYIKQSDCVLLSSNVEGFPNILVEALACERPVISTDCYSGPREILAPSTDFTKQEKEMYELGEYGMLTAVNNVNALAAAMKKMAEDDVLRKQYAAKALTRAKEFDVTKIKRAFLEAFSA